MLHSRVVDKLRGHFVLVFGLTWPLVHVVLKKEEAGRASADISDAEFLRVSEILRQLVLKPARQINKW